MKTKKIFGGYPHRLVLSLVWMKIDDNLSMRNMWTRSEVISFANTICIYLRDKSFGLIQSLLKNAITFKDEWICLFRTKRLA